MSWRPFRSRRPFRPGGRIALVFATLCLLTTLARAQVLTEAKPPPWPDPKHFARGFYASGELGALVFLGRIGKYASAGPALGLRVGYDFLRYIGVEGRFLGSLSDAETPAPRLGQSFGTYYYGGDVVFSLPIRKVRLFLEGGGGGTTLSSNILAHTGVTHDHKTSFAITGGTGIDYHTLNRHFSVGLDVDYYWLGTFANSHALTATAYLRYEH